MAGKIEKTVFISYRRATPYHARAVYQDLKQHRYDVFLDVQSVNSGEFKQIILRQIEARSHFVIVLTPNALERINEPNDWLRLEIEHAIDFNRNIVPLMFDNFQFDLATKAKLPSKLAHLPDFNYVEFPPTYFEEAMKRLRTRFLRIAVDTRQRVVPISDIPVIERAQAQVASQPVVTPAQLIAEHLAIRAWQHNESGNYEEAIAMTNESIRLNPQFSFAFAKRAYAKHRLGDINEAIADYSEAVGLEPYHAETYCNRGVAYRENGEFELALADYSEAIRLDPKYAAAYYNRGLLYAHRNEYEHAIADFTETILLDSSSKLAYNNRAVLYGKTGKRDRAIADFDEAIRLDPEYAEAYNNRGAAYFVSGDKDRAIEDYSAAIRADLKYGDAYYNRGSAYRHKGEVDRAIADLDEAIHLNPKHIWAHFIRGYIYQSERHDNERAIADYDAALHLDPLFLPAYRNRASAYRMLGKITEAEADERNVDRLEGK